MEAKTQRTAKKQRAIQSEVAAAEKRQPKDKPPKVSQPKAMQAGARKYPAPPFPKQHQPKPGVKSKLDPAPLFDAPFYKSIGQVTRQSRPDNRW